MGSRRKRPTRIVDLGRFVADAEDMNRKICSYSGNLRVSCAHYRALIELHDALMKAVRTVLGEDPPWTHDSSTHRTPRPPVPGAK